MDFHSATFQAIGVTNQVTVTEQAALEAARATDGLVDPTVGAAMRELGYDRDFDVVVTMRPRPTIRAVPASGWESVRLEHHSRRIQIGSSTELDLGATAKAFSADRIARAVNEVTGSDVLVSLGGDISVVGAPEGGWPIHAPTLTACSSSQRAPRKFSRRSSPPISRVTAPPAHTIRCFPSPTLKEDGDEQARSPEARSNPL